VHRNGDKRKSSNNRNSNCDSLAHSGYRHEIGQLVRSAPARYEGRQRAIAAGRHKISAPARYCGPLEPCLFAMSNEFAGFLFA